MTAEEDGAATSAAVGERPTPVWSERVPGLVLMVLGAAVGLEATTFDVAFLSDPVGPKALPYLVAVALTVSGIHQARRPEPGTRWPERTALARIALAISAFLGFALILPWLGFLLSTTLVVAALSQLFFAVPRKSVPAAAALAFVLWLLFVWVLALPLPVGRLWMP
jgi:putative tricarboxylic transport membrane protein